LVQNFSKIKVHNTLVLLTLVYGNETWALRIKDKITDINQEEIFQKNCQVHSILPQKKLRNFGRTEIKTN